MKVSLSIAEDGNLEPLIYNCLRSLPDVALHHSQHRLRHPLAIYSLSSSRVIKAFQEILDENDKIYQVPMDDDGTCKFETSGLLKAQQELLDALMAHIDDCYQILKALYPVDRNQSKKVSPFANRWLEQANHPTVELFKTQITPYRETIAPIVNKMKHEHGRLRAIVMRNPYLLRDPRARIAGYFIEGVDSNGTVGSDAAIHGGNYAVSFHHDLRYHFVHLYKLGKFLADAIVTVINREYHLQFEPKPYRSDLSLKGSTKSVAERIAQLPFLFYVNEVVKPISTVEVAELEEDVRLILDDEFMFRDLGTLSASKFPVFEVALQYPGDSVTRSWRLPYFQGGQLKVTVNNQNEITGMSLVDLAK